MKTGLFFILMLLPFTLWSADKATLFLTGHIPIYFDIRIEPVLGGLDTLNLEDGETALKIADVAEISNYSGGYAIFLESVNGGKLLHADDLTSVPYQIQYGVAGAMVTPPVAGSPLQVKSTGSLSGLTFNFEEVFIDVTPTANLSSGAYTDSLILSIQGL